jgi:hypothetical protein
MKFYSEKLNKLFDTEAALKDAEKILEKECKKHELGKRALSQKIEEAEVALEEAYVNYDKVREEAARILDESNKQVIELLNTAKGKITEAEKARTDAIVAFNQQYGTYRANYTGERAKRESNRVNKIINDVFANALSYNTYNNKFDKFFF